MTSLFLQTLLTFRLSFPCPNGFVMELILQQSFKVELIHINSHLGNFIRRGNLMLWCRKKWLKFCLLFLSTHPPRWMLSVHLFLYGEDALLLLTSGLDKGISGLPQTVF